MNINISVFWFVITMVGNVNNYLINCNYIKFNKERLIRRYIRLSSIHNIPHRTPNNFAYKLTEQIKFKLLWTCITTNLY